MHRWKERDWENEWYPIFLLMPSKHITYCDLKYPCKLTNAMQDWGLFNETYLKSKLIVTYSQNKHNYHDQQSREPSNRFVPSQHSLMAIIGGRLLSSSEERRVVFSHLCSQLLYAPKAVGSTHELCSSICNRSSDVTLHALAW